MKTQFLLLNLTFTSVIIFLILILLSLALIIFSTEDEPIEVKPKFDIKPEDKEKFIDKVLLDEEIYGYRSLNSGRVYPLTEKLPNDPNEQFEPITRKEFESKGIQSLTNHIDSIINAKQNRL